MAEIVAIEQHRVIAERMKPLLEPIGDRGFARSGKTGEPQATGLLPFEPSAGLAADRQRLPVDVARPPQGMRDHACTDRIAAHPIDQDESTEMPLLGERRERQRALASEMHVRELVELEPARGKRFAGFDIHPIADFW